MMTKATKGLLKELAERVRQIRAARGLTAREVSQAAGISLRFYAQLEAGEANIAIGRLARVSEVLGATMASLFSDLPSEVDRATEPPAGHPRVITLLGLRGAGKSSIGPLLARTLDLPFVELNKVIESTAGLSSTEIFELHGEGYYRKLEDQCLVATLREKQDRVIALPGGIVLNPAAFGMVMKNTTSIWLKADPEEHMKRVLRQGDRRPVKHSKDAMAELRDLLAARVPMYGQADVTIDTTAHTPRSASRKIIAAVGGVS